MNIFKNIKKEKNNIKTTVSCSLIQIYNERIYDLLSKESGLKIRWTKNDQFGVENLYSIECSSAEDAITVYNNGIKNRIMATHKLNIASSRSHSIFTITIKKECKDKYENVIIGKLQFVDLAGSEKTSQTGNIGRHFKESIDINRSLLALRKVILALSGNQYKSATNFVPYRDSKLTSLLKQCLGGNSYCLMVLFL